MISSRSLYHSRYLQYLFNVCNFMSGSLMTLSRSVKFFSGFVPLDVHEYYTRPFIFWWLNVIRLDQLNYWRAQSIFNSPPIAVMLMESQWDVSLKSRHRSYTRVQRTPDDQPLWLFLFSKLGCRSSDWLNFYSYSFTFRDWFNGLHSSDSCDWCFTVLTDLDHLTWSINNLLRRPPISIFDFPLLSSIFL